MKKLRLLLLGLAFGPLLTAQDAIVNIANIATSGNDVTFDVLLTPASVSPVYLGNFDVQINLPIGNTVSTTTVPMRKESAMLINSNGTAIEIAGDIAASGKIINFEPANLETLAGQTEFNNLIAKVTSTVSLGTYKITFNSPFVGSLSCGNHLVYTFSNATTWAQNNVPVIACGIHTGVTVSMKAFLQGPYNAVTGKMKDDLRKTLYTSGANIGKSYIPEVEPYTGLSGFTHIGGGGGEIITQSILADKGDNSIVDWVFIELRDATVPTAVFHTRSALIQVDGDIVDVDGVSPLKFTVADASKSYFISVRHRNHLGARTNTVVKPIGLNLTVSSTPAYVSLSATNDARKTLSDGKMALWSGNVIQDGKLKYTGASNDRAPILVLIGGINAVAIVNGYHKEDVNMDGIVKYTGANNDRAIILLNIGGTNAVAILTEQF
jgi:hypothetical protein